jgi:membrane protein implicated in regulation of membrane protease activity
MSTSSSEPPPRRARSRRVSRTRQTFLTAIEAQLNGTRVLALIVLAVCLAGGVYWLVGTTGSPVIGVAFIALALVLAVTVYSFVQVMYMFTGKR